jgi:hypothetical protein
MTYGTFQGGAHLIPAAWATATHLFEIDQGLKKAAKQVPNRPRAVNFSGPLAEAPRSPFKRFPVDVFIADHSRDSNEPTLPVWCSWLDDCATKDLPKVVVQVWPSFYMDKTNGPMAKSNRKLLRNHGYKVSFHFMKATDYGSAVAQDRLVVFGFRGTTPVDVASLFKKQLMATPRPMANCLRPFGVGSVSETAPQIPDLRIPECHRDPMPPVAHSWIKTSDGYRRLHPDELAKGLGMPSSWMVRKRQVTIKPFVVDRLTSVHLWETVGLVLHGVLPSLCPSDIVASTHDVGAKTGVFKENRGKKGSRKGTTHPSGTAPQSNDDAVEWEWTIPDLRPNRPWYRQRLFRLKKALLRYPEDKRGAMLHEGKEDLKRHRANYGDKGAVYLQLLWWEFPEYHWEAIRIGSSMNFLKEPEHRLSENAEYTPEMLQAAIEFINELIQLGSVERCPEDDPLVANAPLFVVPKPGTEPIQWRIISDMKRGGQNDAIGKDPVYLPRVDTILPHLYTGGWSSVIDASKFFYQFKTMISERKFLGLIHPETGVHYRYRGLPMGSANSPAIAGRLGASFLRKLRERFPVFQGTPTDNTWWSQMEQRGHDPTLGHGRVLVSDDDGLGACLMWVHVDDFFVHAPTKAKLIEGLNRFMDMAVDVGLLCNPKKVVPPAQIVKYCGFLYDSVNIPTLSIPEDKRTRALAIVQYCQSKRQSKFPSLSLAVVTGILQSLVDATPSRIGQTFLRRLHNTLHNAELEVDSEQWSPSRKYYQYVVLDDDAWKDLDWWRRALEASIQRPVRPVKSGTLTAMFGDGSGTGTGGTSETMEHGGDTELDMWMGVWNVHVHHFSSNWKELCTIRLALRRESERAVSRCRDSTLFYFTDNEVSYHLVNGGASKEPRLQALLHEIKFLELELGCHLVVVHVPGTTMILQGADGLSRGVWISPWQERVPTRQLLSYILAPVKLLPGWNDWLRQHVVNMPVPSTTVIDWTSPWDPNQVLDLSTTWIPPPEMASQAISFVLEAWVERPATTSAVFIIPRVLTRSWQYLSKHTETLRVLRVGDCPLLQHPVPVVVLCLRHYKRCLPVPFDHRMDPSPFSNYKRFRHEAELLRGLSGADVST